MITTEQLFQLVVGSPENLVFHIVTLLVIQATLGISVWQWQRNRQDTFAWRLFVGALALLIIRLLFFGAILLTNSDSINAVRTLPPIEQALNTLILIFMIWTLSPAPARIPRLSNVVLILLVTIVLIAYAFLAQQWAAEEPGVFFGTTSQSLLWNSVQIGMLLLGLIWVFTTARERYEWVLRTATLALLLTAHILQASNGNDPSTITAQLPVWVRLGHFVTFPLLAIIAYRHSIQATLHVGPASKAPKGQAVAQLLHMLHPTLESPDLDRTLHESITFVENLLPAAFVAIGAISQDDTNLLRVVTRQNQGDGLRHFSWGLNLTDWPGLRLALKQRHAVQLAQDGLGARQLRDIYAELNVTGAGALLIEPLVTDTYEIGVLLLAAKHENSVWTAPESALTPSLASYIAQIIANVQRSGREAAHTRATNVPDDTATLGRLLIAEKERDTGLARIETLNHLLQRAEARAKAEEEHATRLSNSLRELRQRVDEQVKQQNRPVGNTDPTVAELKLEVSTLRESLQHAEEALAIAAAGEQGLSADWVMRTITRYSGELEVAQAQLKSMEKVLQLQNNLTVDDKTRGLLQALRSPMTSIAGYTELLLSEDEEPLTSNQRNFLKRVRGNVERLQEALNEIGARSMGGGESDTIDAITENVVEVVDIAIDTIIEQVQARNLKLSLNIDETLPQLPIAKTSLHQIVAHLLNNACHVSMRDQEIALSIITRSLDDGSDRNGIRYLELSVSDQSVGVQPALLPYIFDQSRDVETPFVPGIKVAHELVTAANGRIWVESTPGIGNRFSVLLPVIAPAATTEVSQPVDLPSTVAE